MFMDPLLCAGTHAESSRAQDEEEGFTAALMELTGLESDPLENLVICSKRWAL